MEQDFGQLWYAEENENEKGVGGDLRSQSTDICRVQSTVWRLPKYWPPPPPSPLHPARVSSPRTKDGGGTQYTRRAVRGWGVNILEDARHWIGLLQYNPSTPKIHQLENLLQDDFAYGSCVHLLIILPTLLQPSSPVYKIRSSYYSSYIGGYKID
jgi:hypothetical protein